jgi:hypothetical protein
MSKRILLVGHCGVDGPRLQREIASKFDSVEAERINSMEDLEAAVADGADLLLVNREPIGFAPLMGVDVIRQLHEEYPDQKAILVSDYEDAQEEAAGAGALPGFGKADIGSPKFTETVRSALGS